MALTREQEALTLLRNIFGVDSVQKEHSQKGDYYSITLYSDEKKQEEMHRATFKYCFEQMGISTTAYQIGLFDAAIQLTIDAKALETTEVLERIRNDKSFIDAAGRNFFARLIENNGIRFTQDSDNKDQVLLSFNALNRGTPWRYDDDTKQFTTVAAVKDLRKALLVLRAVLDVGKETLPMPENSGQPGIIALPAKLCRSKIGNIQNIIGHNDRSLYALGEALAPVGLGVTGVGSLGGG